MRFLRALSPRLLHTARPTYRTPPFGYAEMDFPESWLNDPALALFGGFRK